MERRFYIGIGLLGLLLVLGVFAAWAMEQGQMPLAEKLELAALSEDLQTGIDLARQAKKQWKSCWKAVAAVADQTPMDEIDTLFAELEVYARENEQVHFAACCSQLASLLRAVAEAHKLSWWNML